MEKSGMLLLQGTRAPRFPCSKHHCARLMSLSRDACLYQWPGPQPGPPEILSLRFLRQLGITVHGTPGSGNPCSWASASGGRSDNSHPGADLCPVSCLPSALFDPFSYEMVFWMSSSSCSPLFWLHATMAMLMFSCGPGLIQSSWWVWSVQNMGRAHSLLGVGYYIYCITA